MTRLRLAAIATGVAVVALLVGMQVYLTGSDAEFLAQPIALDDGAEIVAIDAPRRVDPSEPFTVELYLDRPSSAPPRLHLTPLGIETPGEPRPALDRRTFSTDDLHSAVVPVSVPPYIADSPGSYTLRLAGRARTFGLVEVEERA